MHPLANIAIKAIRSASKIILRAIDRLDTIQIEAKTHNDFVTEVDKQAEQEIIKIIHKSYPDHAICGEESGTHGSSDYTWIIDPIDGTTNFFHGHPHFCTSIGIKYKNRIEHGVIYDHLRQELFTATLGAGAFLNDRRIRVAQKKQLTGSLITLCIGNKYIKNHLENYLKILTSVLPKATGIRHSGSAALDFAYVACGRIDGIFAMDLAIWDIAAGILLIKEAGGIVTDFSGNNNYLTTGNVIAGNKNISQIVLELAEKSYHKEDLQ